MGKCPETPLLVRIPGLLHSSRGCCGHCVAVRCNRTPDPPPHLGGEGSTPVGPAEGGNTSSKAFNKAGGVNPPPSSTSI